MGAFEGPGERKCADNCAEKWQALQQRGGLRFAEGQQMLAESQQQEMGGGGGAPPG